MFDADTTARSRIVGFLRLAYLAELIYQGFDRLEALHAGAKKVVDHPGACALHGVERLRLGHQRFDSAPNETRRTESLNEALAISRR